MNTLVIVLYRPGTRRRCLNDNLTSVEAATESETTTHTISAFLESFTDLLERTSTYKSVYILGDISIFILIKKPTLIPSNFNT